jgi:DNA primase catalytic core
VRLIRRGRELAGLCPFHHEKTPSFYVVEDKGFFHCFGCGAHGDAVGYLMRAENLDFIEAIERLAAEAGLTVPQQTPQERERAQRQKTLLEALAAAASFYENRLWSPAGARAREYLATRGLDEETIRRFRLGWAPEDRQTLRRALSGEFPEALLLEGGLLRQPESGEPYDYFRGRVLFPIGDRSSPSAAARWAPMDQTRASRNISTRPTRRCSKKAGCFTPGPRRAPISAAKPTRTRCRSSSSKAIWTSSRCTMPASARRWRRSARR